MQNLKRIGILGILLLGMLMGQAAALVNLTGNVTDIAETGISGATVQIVGSSSTTTNSSGGYEFLEHAEGNYSVYADASGYYRGINSVELIGNNVSQNFRLTAPNYTIGDVDDIFIDVIATGGVEIKDEVPTVIDLGILWLILAMLVSIVALAVGLFLIAPETIGKKMKRR